jgi:hypothetical protein
LSLEILGASITVDLPPAEARLVYFLAQAYEADGHDPHVAPQGRGWLTVGQLAELVERCTGYRPEDATVSQYLWRIQKKLLRAAARQGINNMVLEWRELNPGAGTRLLERVLIIDGRLREPADHSPNGRPRT